MNLYESDEYAIGLTAATMAPLRLLNIAFPDQVVWRDAEIYYQRGDYSRVGDGLPSFEWIWDVISIARLSSLLSLLQNTDSAWVYVRTARRNGLMPNIQSEFVVTHSIMYRPIISGQEGEPIARSSMGLQTVKISFVSVELMTQYGYL